MNFSQTELNIFDCGKPSFTDNPSNINYRSKKKRQQKKSEKQIENQIIEKQLELDLFNEHKAQYIWVLATKISPEGISDKKERFIVDSEILRKKKNLIYWHDNYYVVNTAHKRHLIKSEIRLKSVPKASLTKLDKVELLRKWFKEEITYSIKKNI
ncbi:hypothetical protein WOSG25_110820 [Weissella oryzae SG25]|uniref:Uncharacterized protein n=1 Tax=Weissella oryzae (strain DSM 25784 / JCM 18191 / LMG 30913 / SG25) TaxID=1329250 RepID=A0A069CVU8_WEIOS|nr:hypothetical protein [Weissella oryzae]GAK31604.1 hypothetical protein WOSG25_110820 [Weissella oryzae SG25]